MFPIGSRSRRPLSPSRTSRRRRLQDPGAPGSFKNIRTMAATRRTGAGLDGQVKWMLGHSRGGTMTDRYIDLMDDDLKAMIAALDRAERGMAPHSAPQAGSEGASANA